MYGTHRLINTSAKNDQSLIKTKNHVLNNLHLEMLYMMMESLFFLNNDYCTISQSCRLQNFILWWEQQVQNENKQQRTADSLTDWLLSCVHIIKRYTKFWGYDRFCQIEATLTIVINNNNGNNEQLWLTNEFLVLWIVNISAWCFEILNFDQGSYHLLNSFQIRKLLFFSIQKFLYCLNNLTCR